MILSLGEPGVLVGDGTMPYPGKLRALEAPDVTETVNETKLGKTRLLLGELGVPYTSDLLEVAVCTGITGMVFVNRVVERPPVPGALAAEDVEIDSRVNDGCEKEMMV